MSERMSEQTAAILLIAELQAKNNALKQEVQRLRGDVKASWDRHHETAMRFNDVNGRLNRLLERLNAFVADLRQMFPEAASTSREGWDIVCGVKHDLKAIIAEGKKETPDEG